MHKCYRFTASILRYCASSCAEKKHFFHRTSDDAGEWLNGDRVNNTWRSGRILSTSSFVHVHHLLLSTELQASAMRCVAPTPRLHRCKLRVHCRCTYQASSLLRSFVVTRYIIFAILHILKVLLYLGLKHPRSPFGTLCQGKSICIFHLGSSSW